MPNWVDNTLTISGSEEDIAKIKEQLARPKPVKDGEEVEDRVISFWNIKSPPLDKLNEYWETHGWTGGVATGQTSDNWYNFNNREWGTKWDACDANQHTDEKTTLGYTFNTAWSPPTLFGTLSEQYPDVCITLRYEEEQGWGGEIEYVNGVENEMESWDIPESHADYAERDNTDGCVCAWNGDDPEDWYDDCPDKGEKIKELHELTLAEVEKIEDISEMLV